MCLVTLTRQVPLGHLSLPVLLILVDTQDRQNRTGNIGLAEQKKQKRTGRKGKAEQDSRTRQANRTGKTDRQKRTGRTKMPRQE